MGSQSKPFPVALAIGAAVVLLSTCGEALRPHDLQADDGRVQLQGTWLREYSERGVQVRRVLALQADGAFREQVRVQEASGAITEYAHEGTWLFDGTNLKRRYTLMNGKPPSRLNLPFATFQISFDSRNAFTGVDHIRGHRVQYRRLAFDTASDGER